MNILTPSRILVADDDIRGILFLKGLLMSEGYEIECVQDGPSALAKAEEWIPDAIVCDVMMPGMDGFEVCRNLRAHPTLNQIPILLLTALDDRESKLAGLESGADDFLTKPFDASELLIRIRTITQLNRFRRLSEERERFEHLVALSPDGIVVIDHKGKIVLANNEFARIANLQEAGQAHGQCFFDWLNKEYTEKVQDLLRASLRGDRRPPVEIFVSNDSEIEPGAVEVTACRIPWEGHTLCQLVLRDVSDKKRLESQVMRFQRIELLGEMAGSVAHDMNNVLSAVAGNLNLLEMTVALDDESRERMGTIQQSLQRGNGILRQLLSFTRGSDGTLNPVEVSEIIKEVADLVHPMMKYNYKIERQVQEDLPAIMADANQLHQVLMNLCVNARDAMPEGGTLTIGASLRSLDPAEASSLAPDAVPGSYVCISVGDTGTGMPPEVKARIFAPFFTTKPQGKGTGLGLATVMRLTRRHKGFVTVDTEVGKGTTFRCFLPILK